MLRVARMASTMTFVVVAVLSWAQCILMEMTLPHGATATISLDVGQTSLSKAQILGDLQGLGEKHGITIIKSVSRPAGIDLVSVGARQPDAPQPVLFMNPALSGTLTNAASLGDASLQGTLSVSALPNASIDDLRSWGKESGIRVSVLQTTQSQRILSVAQRSGGWLALVGVGALTAGVALGWFASRAHSREVRLLAGIRTSRLHVEDSGAIIVSLIVPDAAVLVGMLMLGNLMKECGVVDRIQKTAGNELMNIITIFLALSVGCTTSANTFLNSRTLFIIVLGLIAFSFGTAAGVLCGKVMYILTGGQVNPLIGSAGVSAVPMAARVSQKVGQSENPSNFLLMHAMGPNVAGVIGSAVAAGILINIFG